MVGGQALVHRGDDRRAAANAGLEQEGHVMLLGQGQQFGTVGSDHLLVGGADTAAAFQALADIRVGKPGAADGLHHDLDLGVSEDGIDRVGKQGGVRRGREIADVLLAVNRAYGKSDYIPCICWGRNARYAGNLSVGSRIQLWGRIQSREYQKRVGENNVVSRVAYEISVNKMEYIDDGINLERKVADSGNIG